MRGHPMNRRTFVRRVAGAGCAAAAALAFPAEPAPPATSAPPPPSPATPPLRRSWFDLYGGFRVGLRVDSLRGLPLDQAIAKT
ncbi:MAG: hypothetical protein JXP34_24735, partial [Planctomycetes bacterium]|nr:hypothetical protein [Planctomycetota bacterium]